MSFFKIRPRFVLLCLSGLILFALDACRPAASVTSAPPPKKALYPAELASVKSASDRTGIVTVLHGPRVNNSPTGEGSFDVYWSDAATTTTKDVDRIKWKYLGNESGFDMYHLERRTTFGIQTRIMTTSVRFNGHTDALAWDDRHLFIIRPISMKNIDE